MFYLPNLGSITLPAQSQSSHYFVITPDVRLLQIFEQFSSLLDHLQQAATRMIILLVNLEMLLEFVDSLTQQRDLDRGRTRIRLMGAKICHDLFFCFSC